MTNLAVLQDANICASARPTVTGAQATGMVVEVAADLEFDAALALWSRSQMATVYNHPVWWRAAHECYGSARPLYAVSVHDGAELCGYWLFWEKRFGPKDAFAQVLEPVGARVCDYVMPLVAESHESSEIAAAMLDALNAQLGPRTMILWPKADDVIAADSAISCIAANRNLLVHRNVRRCHRMALSPDYGDVEARWSHNHRSQVRRRVRKLERTGATEFRVAETRDEILQALPGLFAMHRDNWRARGGGSEFDDPANVHFFERLVEGLPMDLLHFSQIHLDGKPITHVLDFCRNGEILGYKGTFDLAHKSLSPGMVHVALNAKWGCENGYTALDFMQGEERYKLCWTSDTRETVSHAIAAPAAFPVWAWNTKLRNLIIEYKV